MYETKTVQAIRGAEARTIEKWERAGWEAIGQESGRLRTEITLRRPRPKRPWLLLAAGGGVLVLLIVFALIMGAIEGKDPSNEASQSVEPSQAVELSEDSSAAPDATQAEAEPTDAEKPGTDGILTAENNGDFAALLASTDTCSDLVATFASNYAGRTIQFDGSIGAMGPHGDYDTRYDMLISFGDFSETTSYGGPSFQFRDKNISDLHLTGDDIPDSIGVGDNVRVTAEVDQFLSDPCLLLLDPVETEAR